MQEGIKEQDRGIGAWAPPLSLLPCYFQKSSYTPDKEGPLQS